MAGKIVIDCIGSQVLTVTIDGAWTSVPLNSDMIRISGHGKEADFNLNQLPLIYDFAALGGRLHICDYTGRLIYCWRTARPMSPGARGNPSLNSTVSAVGGGRHPSASLNPHSMRRSPRGLPTPSITPSSSMGRQNSEGLPRLSVLNDNRIGTSYIDLAKEEADQPTTTITPAQTTFLIHAINKLGRLEGGESSRKPLKIATSPPSRKAQESIDLKSLKAKLQDGSYPSVKAFQDAFKEMIQAATLPDSEHPITKHASKLNCAFRGYMVECPGSKGRPAAPKKRAAASPAKPSRAPQRANAASHPRAAKAAMQNRKYIRDHY